MDASRSWQLRTLAAAVLLAVSACGPAPDDGAYEGDEEATAGAASALALVCPVGRGDCDGRRKNGCEADLRTSAKNCGACGSACAVANGVATCKDGTCGVASCNAGYVLSGGACVAATVPCTVPNGTGASTWTGAGYGPCVVTACNAGYELSGGACRPIAPGGEGSVPVSAMGGGAG